MNPKERLHGNFRLYGRLIAALERRMVQSNVPAGKWRVLLALRSEPRLTNGALVDRIGADPGHLSRTVKGLILRGLVEWEPAAGHKSQRLLSLSAQGKVVADGLFHRWSTIIDSLVTEASHSDFVALQTTGSDLSAFEAPRTGLLGSQGLGWMVERAARAGAIDLKETLEGAQRFHGFGFSEVGAEATLYGRIVGTCLLYPIDADQCIAQLAGFYVERDVVLVAARPLLERVIDAARDLTMVGVVALVEIDTPLEVELKACGLKPTGREEPYLAGSGYKRAARRREYRLGL